MHYSVTGEVTTRHGEDGDMVILDWRSHDTGPRKPCFHCGQPTWMRDADGVPTHKTCAEAALDRRERANKPQV